MQPPYVKEVRIIMPLAPEKNWPVVVKRVFPYIVACGLLSLPFHWVAEILEIKCQFFIAKISKLIEFSFCNKIKKYNLLFYYISE